jgi:hypothetical protein
MPGIVFLIIGGIILFVGLIIYISYVVEKKRTEALKKVADELGFEFFPKGDKDLQSSLSSYHLFTQGHSKRLKNLMRGQAANLQVDIFDYQYTTGGGKHSQTWQQSVLSVQLAQPTLPSFALRPKTFWHKVGALFVHRDIDIEGHPVFTKNYVLRGRDEEAVRALFDEEVLTFLEADKGRSIEGSGGRFIYYRENKRLKPPEVRTLLEDGFKVLAVFKLSEA